MKDVQLEHFRGRLLAWRDEVLNGEKDVQRHLQENQGQSDLFDRATTAAERASELRANDRSRSLIAKIDAALRRIEAGTYGYCEETGEPISLERLEARPIATLSVEAQERHERRKRMYQG